MEGFGLLKAAWMNPQVSAMVIRGISNLINSPSKGDKDNFREMAANHASAFAFEVLAKLEGGIPESATDSSAEENPTIGQYSEENSQISLEKKFSRDVAILYVEERENYYSLRIHHTAWDKAQETETSPPPPIALSQLLETKQSASEILGKVGQYTKYQAKCPIGKLLGWLRGLRKSLRESAQQELSCLIINDRTDFAIPWEMLPLGGQPLGARINLIRWQDIPKPEDLDTLDPEECSKISTLPSPQSSVECCQGNVLIYAKTEELQEIQCLKFYKYVRFAENQAFLSYLQQTQATIGLVYIARHGFLKTTSSRQILSFHSFETYLKSMSFSSSYPSIVFMNACHSQLIRGELSGGCRAGYITSFLEIGAKGVIGTLKEIDENYATQIAQEFFREYQQNPNLTIPEILRRLRYNIYQISQNNPGNEEIYSLYLYTFMYVYYGHLQVSLHLNLAES